MFGLVERASGEYQEALPVLWLPAARCLRDVRPNRIRRSDELHASGPPVERGPAGHDSVEVIREVRGVAVGGEIPVARAHATKSNRNELLAPCSSAHLLVC